MAVTTAPDASLSTLLDDTLPRAYALAVSLTRNRADAEDLVQDAALSACRHFDQFEPGTNFGAWFRKIQVNAFYARYRRDRQRAEAERRLEDAPVRPAARPGSFGALDTGPPGLDLDAVLGAIGALPPAYRTVASLSFVEDLPYAEIADALRLPVGTVRSRLHRARRKLRRLLAATAEEHGVIRRAHPQSGDGPSGGGSSA